MKKRIALIFGGEGRERSISLLSARCVSKLLDKNKYEIIPVFISHRGDWYVGAPDPFGALPAAGATPTFPVMLHGSSGLLTSDGIMRIDAAIPLLHGDFGEDGIIQGTLEAAHIPYVGCDVFSSAVCADKAYTKSVASSLGIKTAKWVVEYSHDEESKKRIQCESEEKLAYPMFIKPARLGSSIGASAVMCKREFDAAYLSASKYNSGVLIEELIPIEYEVECAYLYARGERLFSADGTVRTGGTAYSFKEKYVSGHTRVAKDSTHPYKKEIEELSKKLVRALGIRAIARIDFFVTPCGEIYFNEINTMPGMTKRSLYPSLTENMGLFEGEFLDELIKGAIK